MRRRDATIASVARYDESGYVSLWIDGADLGRWMTKDELYALLVSNAVTRMCPILLTSMDPHGEVLCQEIFTLTGAIVPFFEPVADFVVPEPEPAVDLQVLMAEERAATLAREQQRLAQAQADAERDAAILAQAELEFAEQTRLAGEQAAHSQAQADRLELIRLDQARQEFLLAEQARLVEAANLEQARLAALAQPAVEYVVNLEPDRPRTRPEDFVPLDSARKRKAGESAAESKDDSQALFL